MAVEAIDLRGELAAHLAAVTSAVAVHAAPAEVTAVPSLVVHPAPSEDWVPMTLSGQPMLGVQLVIEVVVARTDMAAALELLEQLALEVLAALRSFPGGSAMFEALGDLGDVTVGGQEALSGQVSVVVGAGSELPAVP